MKEERKSSKCRGGALVEFAAGLPFLALLSVGVFAVGINLDRYLVVQQTAGASGNMYDSGLDVSQQAVQQLFLKGANSLQMTTSGGDGVIYLTTIQKPASASAEITRRFIIGNQSIASSTLGMPSAQSDGTVDPPVPATLPSGVTLIDGQQLDVAEVYHKPDDLHFPGFATPDLLSAIAYF